MIFIETSVFTRQIQKLLDDDEYRLLQSQLVVRPEMGAIIPGSGGLRKVRWAAKGQGKRGGVRVIYYWAVSDSQILLLYVYPKSAMSDLSPAQIKLLRQVVERDYP
jgi:mRNA-degrading endonuclease RelE of RelBE toxin-antitoxin system